MRQKSKGNRNREGIKIPYYASFCQWHSYHPDQRGKPHPSPNKASRFREKTNPQGKQIAILIGRGENCTCADCPVLYGGECYTTKKNNAKKK